MVIRAPQTARDHKSEAFSSDRFLLLFDIVSRKLCSCIFILLPIKHDDVAICFVSPSNRINIKDTKPWKDPVCLEHHEEWGVHEPNQSRWRREEIWLHSHDSRTYISLWLDVLLHNFIASYLLWYFSIIICHQMIYYVEDLADTIRLYHSLLKENGRLLILLAARRFTFCKKEKYNISEIRSSSFCSSCFHSNWLFSSFN